MQMVAASPFQSKAILLMLSLGQFVKVIEMLNGMRHFDRAALFIEACMEFELLDSSEETSILGVHVEWGVSQHKWAVIQQGKNLFGQKRA